MDSRDFYNVLIADLKKASLSPRQIRAAIIDRASQDVALVDELLKEHFASWIPSGVTPIGDTGFDFDASGSYVSRVERVGKDDVEVEESPTPEAEEAALKRKELVERVTEAACLAEKRGFVKQAKILDEVLYRLI